MAMGFFVDVLEVESLDMRKDKNGVDKLWARLRLAGGSISVQVRSGTKILEGWSGKASGSVRVLSSKRDFQGHLSDLVTFQPVELDTWVPGEQVLKQGFTALDSFMGKK